MTKTTQNMMSISEIECYMEREGISVRAFWRELDGEVDPQDRRPLPRRVVEGTRAQLCSTDQ